jgi:hypothetical protein
MRRVYMKRLLILCLTAGLLFSAFGQLKKKVPAEVVKNKLDAGGYFGYEFNSADEPQATTDFTIPYAKYSFQTVQKETNKFFLNGEFGYNMNKTTIDGEAPEGWDEYETRLFLNIDPEMRLYLTKEMFEQQKKKSSGAKKTGKGKVEEEEDVWMEEEEEGGYSPRNKNRWFISAGLPVSYEMINTQFEDDDTETSTFVDIVAKLGYDDKLVDIKKLSPWAKFEDGIFGYLYFDYRAVETYYGEDTETRPMAFGARAEYAYDSGNYVKNSMIKAFGEAKYQMTDEAARFFPWEFVSAPFVGKYYELEYGVEYAQDITDRINLNAVLTACTSQLDDEDGNSINSFDLSTRMNYYPIPELNVFGGFGVRTHLKEEDSEPDYKLHIGAAYTFDFIQIKKNAGLKKTESSEEGGEADSMPEEEW